MWNQNRKERRLTPFLLAFSLAPLVAAAQDSAIPSGGSFESQMAAVLAVEQARAATIRSVMGSVVAIYDSERQGGGSGVVIDPSGLALTNHHVIMGAGVSGQAGLADGKLREWELVATDPGGDLALIRLKGEGPFPHAALGNSDRVRVGDWALAMGNPFVLAENHVPTVTLGIVSGIGRYQAGAGLNELVYGNCLQVDSSINPGNSGGPLFDLAGAVIGINGRASFLERGRVNVGLGYAISSNQARNFLGDLMATWLVQHGTLDASFGDYSGKGVLCSTINDFSDAARAGLELSDQLVELEGIPVHSANQVASLICTLPRNWPASLRIRKPDGSERRIHVRLVGLPYQQPNQPPPVPPGPGEDEDSGRKRQAENQQKMVQLLASPAGTVRNVEMNHFCRDILLSHVCTAPIPPDAPGSGASRKFTWRDSSLRTGDSLEVEFGAGSASVVHRCSDGKLSAWICDGSTVFEIPEPRDAGQWPDEPGLKTGFPVVPPSAVKRSTALIAALSVLAVNGDRGDWFPSFGDAAVDGSDKADGRPVVRLKQLDVEKDWFYTWLSTGFVDHSQSDRKSDLVRAAADLDCDGKAGGVVFRGWRNSGGLRVPSEILLVRGIGEETVGSWILQVPSADDPAGEGGL